MAYLRTNAHALLGAVLMFGAGIVAGAGLFAYGVYRNIFQRKNGDPS